MKTLIRNLLLIVLFSFSFILSGFSQDIIKEVEKNKVKLTVGIGFPDAIFGGIKYQVAPNHQIGLNYGTIPKLKRESVPKKVEDKLSIISVEHDYHFGRVRKGRIKPWYFKQSLYFIQSETLTRIYKEFVLDLGMGIEKTLFWKIGINIETGWGILLFTDIKHKVPQTGGGFLGNIDFGPDICIVPTLRFKIFCRIN